MIIGMGIVFIFLILLMLYMKFVPILSKIRKSKRKKITTGNKKNEKLSKSIELKYDQNQITEKDPGDDKTVNEVPEAVVAAIATAIYSHTGKKPKQLLITAPGRGPEQYNIWGAAGRQDLMLARDISGQVGFQY
jgi:sodium pump decarboxylase gamma subunit